jgi:hypothetical protein
MRTRSLCLLGLSALLVALAGCVERRMVIITDPPHAIVFDEKNQPLGASPVDRSFVYYGKYRHRLVKDGYETMIVEENVKAPWYEYFPLDFFAENIVPWTLRDVRYFRYTLKPLPVTTPQAVLDEANVLRAKGQTIGVPLPTPSPAAPVAPPPGPAPQLMPPADMPVVVPPPPPPPAVSQPRPMPGP